MVTGNHAEVFREESQPGQRRRYSKRFLATEAGDLRHWTEREGRILTRLAGLGVTPVPCVEQVDRGAAGQPALVRTCDAGVTVDHWATLLPVQRDGTPHRHVFEDCAHWWALARHCLMALDTLHELHVVHLDFKADNVCIPMGPAEFDPGEPGAVMKPCFEQLALIDFAFSMIPGESLNQPLPIARQPEYDYQSPRLLKALEAGRKGDLTPTRQLDWRCDVFSLAAMLRRYLPGPEAPPQGNWTPWHLEQACSLIRRLLDAHDADEPAHRPHRALIALAKGVLADAALSASLGRGWALAAHGAPPPSDLATPLTRIATPVGARSPRAEPAWVSQAPAAAPRAPARRGVGAAGWLTVVAVGAVLGAGWWAMEPRIASERNADAALTAAADAMSAAPSLPASKPAPAQALPPQPPPVAATQPVLQPAETEAAASRPIVDREAPAASAVAAAPAAAARIKAIARTKPVARSRTATNSPVSPASAAGRSVVNQAERERALEWLTKRGPSPQPGVQLPPAPATTQGSAAEASKADPHP